MSLATLDERVALITPAQFLAADGTTWKTIATGGAAGQRIDDVLLSSNGAAAHVVEFRMTIGAISYQLGSVSVAAGAGYAGTPPVQLGATVQPTNSVGWVLSFGASFQARVAVVMGAAEALDVVAFGGAF